MSAFARLFPVLALGVLAYSQTPAQSQEQPYYVRDVCVKVKQGKWQEYRTFLRDIAAKLAKARVDAGSIASFTIAEAVAPSGRSARCDYHLVTGFNGFPPETPTPEQTDADLKRAGITLAREAILAKRDELTELVSVDTWRYHQRLGTARKGGYARINFDKVHPGKFGEWLNLEATGWKQLAEAAAKEYDTGWRVAGLVMPAGESLAYNAMTVDLFPSWEALGKGLPVRSIWNKVHPNSDMSAHLNRLAAIRDRPRVDTVKLIEYIAK